jgi:hypothetical protein
MTRLAGLVTVSLSNSGSFAEGGILFMQSWPLLRK